MTACILLPRWEAKKPKFISLSPFLLHRRRRLHRSIRLRCKRRSSRLRRSTYLYLRTAITELERTRFGEALDRFDLCVVLGDALGCQMWIVEARSHDDSDTLDYSSFHVVDPVRLRTTIACQPDDRWRNSLNRHGGFALLQPSGIRNCRRVHPRVPGWRNGVHENPVLGTFNCKNAHQSDDCALRRRIGGLAPYSEQSGDRSREDDLPIVLCDHVRPGSLHRVDRPAEVHAPIVTEIIKGSVLE